jgi:Skp family chaperone for outer membrane proteins
MPTKRTCVAAVLAATLCLAAAAPAAAKVKPTKQKVVVVVVDMNKIFQESKLSKQIQAEFKAWDDGIRLQAQPKLDLLKQKQQALEAGKATLPEAERTKLEKEIQGIQQEVSQIQAKARQEYQERQNAAAQRMQAKLAPILEALGAEYGWDVVVSRGEQNILWSSEAVDHTETLMERMNAETPDAPAPAPAPAPAATPAPPGP